MDRHDETGMVLAVLLANFNDIAEPDGDAGLTTDWQAIADHFEQTGLLYAHVMVDADGEVVDTATDTLLCSDWWDDDVWVSCTISEMTASPEPGWPDVTLPTISGRSLATGEVLWELPLELTTDDLTVATTGRHGELLVRLPTGVVEIDPTNGRRTPLTRGGRRVPVRFVPAVRRPSPTDVAAR